ncbi:MAG TPA: FMN-binding protein [Steroidobacteraceae bacterium]|nr:FMN-binding protein [Steroidobacteraceae bacterium]
MHRSLPFALIGAGSVVALAAAPARLAVAEDFLSTADAQRQLFPEADRFVDVAIAWTPAQRQAVIERAGPQPAHRSLRVWRAFKGEQPLGHVFVDEVIGRQDFITYALAIDANGRLSELEVLSYRESHGGEIRNAAWRRQFSGRADEGSLRVGTDIKNIAGATLSCEHVTQGARWVLALWQVVLRS